MKTLRLNKNQLQEAARILSQGGLVVFPTETVYGLGANGLDEQAVQKIFAAKGRPSDNPLILHIFDRSQLNEIVVRVPDVARTLIEAFWPGPLTLVFEKQPHVPTVVSAGLPTVAVRMPNNSIALELLREVGLPIAAPSANQSGRPSSTNVDHVIEDLEGKVDAILDGGRSVIGIESTVLDVTTSPPTLLRPGVITKLQIEDVIGFSIQSSQESNQPKSPGMKYQHYQPNAKVYWRSGNETSIQEEISTLSGSTSIVSHPSEQDLYAQLRQHDQNQVDHIVIITVPREELAEGMVDRLSKAAKNYEHR
jgi:L-threonylcarbamoyladenylate synthase